MNATHLGDAKNEQNTNLSWSGRPFCNAHTTFGIAPFLGNKVTTNKEEGDEVLVKELIKGNEKAFRKLNDYYRNDLKYSA